MNEYGDKERKEDFNYFLENYQDLYQKHGKKFWVIKNKQFLGCYDSIRSALDEISKTYPLGTFIVQECNGDTSGYTSFVASWQLTQI